MIFPKTQIGSAGRQRIRRRDSRRSSGMRAKRPLVHNFPKDPMRLKSNSRRELSPEDVADAYSLIEPFIHKTPILTSSSINYLTTPSLSIYFKAEVFQKTGAFKFRGASHVLARLPPEILQKGVATHSSGNHAAALACAARQRGIKCYVVMVIAPKRKNLILACQFKQIESCRDEGIRCGSNIRREREGSGQKV
jgi:predicted alternative tryptophan synthase beta-subunit